MSGFYFSIREEFAAGLVIDQKLERIYELANRRLSPRRPRSFHRPSKTQLVQGKGCGERRSVEKSNNRLSHFAWESAHKAVAGTPEIRNRF